MSRGHSEYLLLLSLRRYTLHASWYTLWVWNTTIPSSGLHTTPAAVVVGASPSVAPSCSSCVVAAAAVRAASRSSTASLHMHIVYVRDVSYGVVGSAEPAPPPKQWYRPQTARYILIEIGRSNMVQSWRSWCSVFAGRADLAALLLLPHLKCIR